MRFSGQSRPSATSNGQQEGAEGCWRFCAVHPPAGDAEAQALPPPGKSCAPDRGGADLELRRATQIGAIAAVTEDLNGLRFNRAVAQVYTLANALPLRGRKERRVKASAGKMALLTRVR